MEKTTLILLGCTLLIFAGCAGNNENVSQTKTTAKPVIKSKKNVKKAPKRKVVTKKYKRKIKYKDTSESSVVRLYDPKTKTIVKVQEKEDAIPTSKGGQLFYKKGCNLCHKEKISRVGPSLRKLSRGYKDKRSELIAYLQRKGQPIIQPERGSIMKTQLAKLRILSENEYNALSNYILSGGK